MLAFQGNIREWPAADYDVVKAALARSKGGPLTTT